MFGANLVIPAQICEDLLYGQIKFPKILSQNRQNDLEGPVNDPHFYFNYHLMYFQLKTNSVGIAEVSIVPMANNTRMWNMISSPATPTVCLEQESENFQSRNVTLSMPSQYEK